MGFTIVRVNAFTDKPFKGNPAAVCIMTAPREDAWMQSIAAEMNLSETAFLLKKGDDYSLRWFTPTTEVDLCGHATLASAHALWETKCLPRSQQARFHTRSGLLTAESKGDWVELDFPVDLAKPAPTPDKLFEALKTDGTVIGFTGTNFLVVVETPETIRRLSPDFDLLNRIKARVIVTSPADEEGYDFISRYFAPSVGINEDPVTGSAHCCLGPYWGEKMGKTELVGYQASARGGTVRVRLQNSRVILGGQAMTLFLGQLT